MLQFASLRLGERVTSLRQKGFRAAQHLTQPTTAQVTGRQQHNQLSDHLRLRGVAVATILTVSNRGHLIVHQ